jgi:DNA-directed RNA polymerase
MFDEGKELGENGLRWLKIHCANLAGYDKASFTDRVKFVEENLEDVIDSAKNPLGVCFFASNCTCCAYVHRVVDGG